MSIYVAFSSSSSSSSNRALLLTPISRMISLALILVCATLTCGQEEEVDHDHAHHSGNPLDWLRDSVPGEPGVDYPIFNEVQDTAFSCEDRVFGGYYADPGMGCQGYHVCLNHGNNARKLSFLCPNGTIFQQSKLTCEWWFNVDCTEAQSSYNVNDLIGTGDSLPESNDLGPKRPIPTRNNDNGQRKQPTIVAQPLNPNRNQPQPEEPQVTTEREIQREKPEPQIEPITQTPSRARPGAPRPGNQRPANRRPVTPQPLLVTTTRDTSKIQFPNEAPADVVTNRPVSQRPNVPRREQPAPAPNVPRRDQPASKPNVPRREQPATKPNIPRRQQPAPKPNVPRRQQPAPNVPRRQEPAPKPSVPRRQQPAPKPNVPRRQQPAPRPNVPQKRPNSRGPTNPVRPSTTQVKSVDTLPSYGDDSDSPQTIIPISAQKPQIDERPHPGRPTVQISHNRPQIEERPRPQTANKDRPTVQIANNQPQVKEGPRPGRPQGSRGRPQGQRGNQQTQTTVRLPDEPSTVEEIQTTALPSYGTNGTPQQNSRPTRRPNQGTRNRQQTQTRTQRPQTTVSLPAERPKFEDRPTTPVLQNVNQATQQTSRPTSRPQAQVMTTEIPYSDNSRPPQAGTQSTSNGRPKFGEKVTIPVESQTPRPVNRGRPLFPERTETAPRFQPNQQIDIVEYDVAISGDDIGDIPILFADPFQDIRAPDSLNRLYEVPI